jgi:formylglycine-generating enzyme required for sulfatase activity
MTEQFDVFLCHNSADKPQVKKIAEQLQQYDLKPWLDIWELPPGRSWQRLLEKQIEQISSAAVFVGEDGFGPWQQQELYAFLSEFVSRDCPVIPILLPNAPTKPELPVFLRQFTWVDFRISDPDPMYQLRWGITGKKPPKNTSPSPSPQVSQSPIISIPQSSQSFTETLSGNIKLEMVKIPAGSFLMGTEEAEVIRLNKEYETERYKREMPQHRVNLQEFYLGKYPITQEQYQAVMGNNSLYFENNPLYFENNPKNPVESVSWNDAQEFCQKLSDKTGKKYRLPSEAEWEYACRAGTQTRYYFGDDEKQLGEYAWYIENSGGKTHPVEQKKPNDWGLYDMSGNVWEWCEDGWHDNYENSPKDGTAWNDNHSQTKTRIIRGGSWCYSPRSCRSAYRFNYGNRDYSNGFRVVSPQDS